MCRTTPPRLPASICARLSTAPPELAWPSASATMKLPGTGSAERRNLLLVEIVSAGSALQEATASTAAVPIKNRRDIEGTARARSVSFSPLNSCEGWPKQLHQLSGSHTVAHCDLALRRNKTRFEKK